MPQFTQTSAGKDIVEAFPQRVSGKTIVITGASSGGIGSEIAIALAYGQPGRIFLSGRSEAKIKPVIERMHELNPKLEATFVMLDLADQTSVRDAARQINAATDKLDILINNAGIMCTMPYQTTAQGIELQFGTNHIGHFLLTNLLIPKILAAGKGSRIVNVASTGYTLSDIPFDNVNFDDGKTYNPWLAYAVSKTANILFTVALADKLRSKGVLSFALQPGMPRTNLYNHLTETGLGSFAEGVRLAAERGSGAQNDFDTDVKTLEQAASTPLDAALDPAWEGSSGIFLRNCQPFDVKAYAKDPTLAEKLWEMSEGLVGQKFNL